MSLADARAIHPNLNAVEGAPDEDARTLDNIAAWCERFTPIVVVDAPEGLFLDVTGCAHLFGGEEKLRDQIVTRLHAQGFAARAEIAPTTGAAWAFARYGKRSDDLFTALAPLPVDALRLNEAAAALLHRLGLRTIAQLFNAPRANFTARAGEHAMLRLDQALGHAREVLTPRRPAPPVYALRRFLEPIFTMEAMLEVTQTLCADVLEKLDLRGAGLRRAELHLFGVDGRDRDIQIGASRPERDLKPLMRLFREKLDRAAENLNAEFGIEAARLDIVQMERVDGVARTLVTMEEAQASAEKIDAFVDVLSARLGGQRVLRPQMHALNAPERAGGWKPALSAPACGGSGSREARDEGGLRLSPLSHRAARSDSSPASGGAKPPKDNVPRRPLTMFACPQLIDAIATVPDGPPIRFRWRRVLREVARAEGPERISGDWLGGAPTRDYYRVEDKAGRRYWLYREGLYGEGDVVPRWFVHGLFA
ncbi:DNA polymerase-like protein PA0670 [alpha proteobacterium U9-1i]|nr:DNA polymerase-like protein PA0670 [alpha proteobacterium U9-1i]